MKNLALTKTQSGQALIEALIGISAVLIIVMVLFPLLNKYIETKQTAEQSARYVAWERTVWSQSSSGGKATKTDADLQREIHWRFYSDNSSVLSSNDETTSKVWKALDELPPLLTTDQTDGFSSDSLIKLAEQNNNGNQNNANQSDSLVKANVTNGDTPGMGGTLGDVLSLIDIAGFSVNQKGLYGGRVDYTLATLPGVKPFDDDFTLDVSDQFFVLGDGWNASSRRDAENKVKGLTPSSILDTGFVDTVRNGIGWLPFAKEVRTNSLQLGKVDTEQVPVQRLCKQSGNRCLRRRR